RYATCTDYFTPDGTIDHERAMQDAASEILKGIQAKLHDLLHGTDSRSIKLVMHIDGGASDAKGLEHRKRQKTKETACRDLKSDIRAFKRRRGIKGTGTEIDAAQESFAVKNATELWSPRKLVDSINKNLGKACQIPLEYKAALNDAFKSLGQNCRDFVLESHVCHGEADPCLATTCDSHHQEGNPGKMAVITKDSDLLVYCSVDALLRPNPKDSGFILYEKSKVLEVLGLQDKKFLTLYGMGLKNDFAHNVKSVGPVTNLQIVIKVQEGFYPPEKNQEVSSTDKNTEKKKGKGKTLTTKTDEQDDGEADSFAL
ncbi:hypothetical protein BGZ83_004463, partial [Gryganskiella cystojenkinii]